MMEQSTYEMVISRTTIDKLGIKLYDKASAVIAELIANAYDADAEKVVVEVPLGEYLASKAGGKITDKGYTISVTDDGHGMIPDEVNRHYLQIGKDRRIDPDWGNLSREKNRPVIGRKGIGKLACFGICRIIEVFSAGGPKTEKGYLTAHLLLNYDEIVKDTDERYLPTPGELDRTYQETRGTTVTLHKFLLRKIPEAEVFHRQLAARFGLPQKNWAIEVHDSLHVVEPFTVGEFEIDLLEGTRIDLTGRVIKLEDGTKLPVSGWVGISRNPYRDQAMTGIRIYVRGKIVAQTLFDIPSGFHGEHTLRSYLVGEIHADWLDEDEDLIQSTRQDILWATEIGQAFQGWGQDLVKEIGSMSTSFRRQQAWQIFQEKSRIEELTRERIADPELRTGIIEVAKVIARTSSRESLDDDTYIESLVNLAFSLGPHHVIVEKLHTIAETADSPFEVLVEFFTQASAAEDYELGQIAHERIRAIERLESSLSPERDEAELQKLLEEAPWLIHSDWTPLTKNQTLETARAAFERWYSKEYGVPVVTSAIDYRNKRPDFVLLNHAHALEVVDIKKPGHELNDEDFERLHRYHEAFASFLGRHPEFQPDFPEGHHIVVVCDGIQLSPLLITAYEGLVGRRILQLLSWEELLRRTKVAHEVFLEVLRRSQAA